MWKTAVGGSVEKGETGFQWVVLMRSSSIGEKCGRRENTVIEMREALVTR